MTDDGFMDKNKVISMCGTAGAPREFPIMTELETYWRSLRGNRLVPSRADIQPRQIGTNLRYAFVLERLAPTVARFRLAGMHLNQLLGMEVRGMPLTSFFLPDARQHVGEALDLVFTEPAIARFRLKGDRGIGKPPLEAQMLLLPLKSDMGEVSRILGCLATLGPVGRTPRRFDVVDREIKPLLTTPNTVRGDGEGWDLPPPPPPAAKPPTSIPGFAEHATGYTPPAKDARPPRVADGERPRLYLVKSDE
ncbi:hypothetical protein CLV78_101897 [Aliiruegeria haliotis]|uniref:PAS domain-containing protein n=1 Tax=Aliiruegeria haliotis TaxID=1280846 RepID=A0A2T0S059_9RHOB|nr:PAS domain-containing protein [Aliiruegeria haliotis]PRY26795.1 hypothetical protein CLV78_101897 [Aliiruegeria haliotis]